MTHDSLPPDLDALPQRDRLRQIACRITRSAGWMFDLREQRIIWSDELCALHEVPPGKSPTIPEMYDFIAPEFHQLIRQGIENCIKQGIPFDQEMQVVTAKGRSLWVRSLGSAVRDASGRTLMIEGALQDISEKKAFEQSLRDNEQRFINVAHATTDAVWDWDLVADTIWWNGGMQTVFGFAPDEVARNSAAWIERLHPDDRERVQAKIVEAIKSTTDNWSDEYRYLRRDGSYAYVSDHAILIRGDTRRVIRMVGGITDLSSRKQLERDLQRLNRALRMLTACNELLIRASDEHDLLTAVCELIVTIGGYKMAYVGFAIDDAERRVVPIAHAGDEGYLETLRLSWSEHSAYGRGPAGRTIRSGAPTFVNDLLEDPLFGPWRENAVRHGLRAIVNLPLREHERTFGLLALFSEKVLAVGEEEIRLLQQMANDVAFGIGNLRAQAAQRRADARIREQASLLDKAQDAILVRGAVDHVVRFWNKGAERLYGYTVDEAIGRCAPELLYTDAEAFFKATDQVLQVGEWNGELSQRRKDGSMLTAECRWTLVIDEQTGESSILAINTDISQRKAAAREIEQLAFYDQLTGLPNRQLLVERLLQSKARSVRSGMIGAILFIDLDNFKTLNDTLGHARGDQLLQMVSARLLKCVRENDTVARFGGDEFVVSLVDLDLDAEVARRKAMFVGEKILDALRLPIPLADHEHHGSCSIGITLLDRPEDTVDDLLKRADLAMYQAKAGGRNMLRVFAHDMQIAVNARAESEADLRRALQQKEFVLHYQPQLDAQGRVTGAEALVRWQHPVRGMIPPLEFIFLAEETGLIHTLGKQVLEAACHQLARWGNAPGNRGTDGHYWLSTLTLAVNVSVQQFRHPDFVELVLQAIDDSGIDPHRLKLELTESLLVDDVEATIAKMTALKDRGIGFALDDFGTGYSSLAYLKRLPLDELKIDQSFVRDVLTDSNDAAIARTIVALAQSLGLSVIAEGVETMAQRDFLERHGCNAYQGYLYSRPVPVAAFERFVLDATPVRARA